MKWLQLFNRDLSRRGLLLTLVGLALLLAACWGAWSYVTSPTNTWMARWQVSRYLEKNSSSGSFKTDFAFPPKAEMNRATEEDEVPTEGPRTGKDFETLRQEYLEKQTELLSLDEDTAESEKASRRKALAPITQDLWEFQRAWASVGAEDEGLAQARRQLSEDLEKQIDQASTYSEINIQIGRALWVAEQLLESENHVHRRTGLALAIDATRHALERARNPWLAASICRGYLWPHFGKAEPRNRRSPYYRGHVIGLSSRVFRTVEEPENIIRTYEMLIAQAEDSQTEDWANAMLAMEHERAGNFEEALHHFGEIQSTNQFRWALRRVPNIQRQMR